MPKRQLLNLIFSNCLGYALGIEQLLELLAESDL